MRHIFVFYVHAGSELRKIMKIDAYKRRVFCHFAIILVSTINFVYINRISDERRMSFMGKLRFFCILLRLLVLDILVGFA